MRKLTCTLALLALLGTLLALPTSAEAAPVRDGAKAMALGDSSGLAWLPALRQALAWLIPFTPGPNDTSSTGHTAATPNSSTSTGSGSGMSPGDPGDQAGEVIDPDG